MSAGGVWRMEETTRRAKGAASEISESVGSSSS